MNIEFVNLKRQNRLYRSQYLKAITSLVDSATFLQGKPVEDFEKQFAHFCGTKYCVSLNSGTDALELALRAHQIGPGDEVITVPNSYFSTTSVISKVGAKPVFVDINPQTYTIDVNQIKPKITKHTRAIIPVHLYGQPADMDPIIRLANKHKLVIIEDCCQAHGAKYKARSVPISGTGAFSFYPGKNLGAFGDGGALVTDSKTIATLVKKHRFDGSLIKYRHDLIGSKSRLDTIQAAILSIKLKNLRSWNRMRRQHACTYTRLLKNVPDITLPFEADYSYHVYHLYVIATHKRNQLHQYLNAQGITSIIHYPTPIHLQSPYQAMGFKKGDFPHAEAVAKQILSLPMFPELTQKEIKYTVKHLKQFLLSEKAK